jgi:Reverse transcriptase (RNA-dependent DNA polymerase)
MRRAHPVEFNDAIPVRKAASWGPEELSVLARTEIRALELGATSRNINKAIVETGAFPGLNSDAIKYGRRKASYSGILEGIRASIAAGPGQAGPEVVNISDTSESEGEAAVDQPEPNPWSAIPAAPDFEEQAKLNIINHLKEEILPNLGELGHEFQSGRLTDWVTRSLDGWDGEGLKEYLSLLGGMLKALPGATRTPRPPTAGEGTRRQQRRRERAYLQSLWVKSRSSAAAYVLDGNTAIRGKHTLQQMEDFWRPIYEHPSQPFRGERQESVQVHYGLLRPVSAEEVRESFPDPTTSSGTDRVRARQWLRVPALAIAAIFNVFLLHERSLETLLECRTVFIPKGAGANPGEYRPISVASVVLRHYHKLLAKRLTSALSFDTAQKGFLEGDGVGENIVTLETLIWSARKGLREMHAAVLDVAKAFDSVSHDAIAPALQAKGVPGPIIRYILYTYKHASLRLTVQGNTSAPIRPRRGVLQGDPLSPINFICVFDLAVQRIPPEIGFKMDNRVFGRLGFADDWVLLAGSKPAMRLALAVMEEELEDLGMRLNSDKCSVLSLVPSGKYKKIKVITASEFSLSGQPLKQIGVQQTFKYLGVDFSPSGPSSTRADMVKYLQRISKAPLKPQQRLLVLRDYLIPRYAHKLTFGRVTAGHLRRVDIRIRQAIREWLRLPHDVPVGYYHAPVKEGGLGIRMFEVDVPLQRKLRIDRMSDTDPLMKVIKGAAIHEKRLEWCRKVLHKYGLGGDARSIDLKAAHARRLHDSVDGKELCHSGTTPVNVKWVYDRSDGIPASDYLHYHWVRVNALPSRVRTARGRPNKNKSCRACGVPSETTYHIIQQCPRNKEGRDRRHKMFQKHICAGLSKVGWIITENPRIPLDDGTVWYPDVVAHRNGDGLILDFQVVQGSGDVSRIAKDKIAKYSKLAIVEYVARKLLKVEPRRVRVAAATMTWRGCWERRSAQVLLDLGLRNSWLATAVTRILFGSYMNWYSWNRCTTRFRRRRR